MRQMMIWCIVWELLPRQALANSRSIAAQYVMTAFSSLCMATSKARVTSVRLWSDRSR